MNWLSLILKICEFCHAFTNLSLFFVFSQSLELIFVCLKKLPESDEEPTPDQSVMM